jgi:hypothetical protein
MARLSWRIRSRGSGYTMCIGRHDSYDASPRARDGPGSISALASSSNAKLEPAHTILELERRRVFTNNHFWQRYTHFH